MNKIYKQYIGIGLWIITIIIIVFGFLQGEFPPEGFSSLENFTFWGLIGAGAMISGTIFLNGMEWD